jgi:GTP-binding protein HflX
MRLADKHEGAVVISAASGDGVDHLLTTIGDRLRERSRLIELLVPYERGDVLAAVHREGDVVTEAHEDAATRLRARLDAVGAHRFKEFIVE